MPGNLLILSSTLLKFLKYVTFMLCLEVWKEGRVEGRKVVGKRVERNGYPLPYLDVFKIR